MTNELRAALIPGLSKLADDVAVGLHGDPHVAFTVLVYPDREPAVLYTCDGRPAKNVGTLRLRPRDPSDKTGGERTDGWQRFPMAEFDEADGALGSAWHAMQYRRGDLRSPGERAIDEIRESWERSRMQDVNAALAKAADEAARPARCAFCRRRFTERGLKMHLARNPVCAKKNTA